MKKNRGFGEGKTGIPLLPGEARMVRWLTERDGLSVVGVDGKETGAKVIIRHLSSIGTPSLWHGLYVPSREEGDGYRVVHAWSATVNYRHNTLPSGNFFGRAEYDVYPGSEDEEVRVANFFADNGDGPRSGADDLTLAYRRLTDLGHIASNPQDLVLGERDVVIATAERLPDDIIRAAAHFVLANS